MYCKKKIRECSHKYQQNSYQCKKCIKENLSQHPVTCKDCKYSFYECIKRKKNPERMETCEDFKWW